MTRWAGAGVIIVGASSGIGAALARILAQRGYRLALLSRREDRLAQLCAELNAADVGSALTAPTARAYRHDVRATDDAPRLFAQIVADFGPQTPVRIVIYNAGVLGSSAQGAWSFEAQRDTLETNLIGAVRWLQLGADAFIANGGGTLVGISSVAGERGRRGNSAYQASKAALSVYLESLRYGLRRYGVRVVTVKPGFVATEMLGNARPPKPLVASADAVAARIASAIDSGPLTLYTPGYWAPIMWVMRHLPAAVMARLRV